MYFNSLPNDKILDWLKLKAFADDKKNVTEKLKFVLEKVENILGKGENAGYQHFLLFPQCFQKPTFPEMLKVGVMWLRVERPSSQGPPKHGFIWCRVENFYEQDEKNTYAF